MVNELRTLLRENVEHAPEDHADLGEVLRLGRSRVRRRRTLVGSGAVSAVAVAGLVTALALGGPGTDHATGPASRPLPDAPTTSLADAVPAVAGRDYTELASYTNDNLDADNGQYFDGVTDDGLILFRDGPRSDQLRPRFALLDPATGTKDWLPDLRIGQTQTWPAELGSDRLILVGPSGSKASTLTAWVFDRGRRTWSELTWPGLPAVGFPGAAQVGPDERLYVGVPATQGKIPEGGWPTQAGGDAEDADAQGDSFELWSVSLTDGSDARDEGLRFGELAFTPHSMVWTDRSNGDAGQVHVRDLATGEEHAFDPHSGDRCNLLGFGATDDRVVLSQYCGTYGDVRDDRVQVLTTDGDQVVTIQDSSIDGMLAGAGGDGSLVEITAYERGQAGTYIYDLASGRLLRISDAMAKWGNGGPAPDGTFLWCTPTNRGHGQVQHVGELTP
ncbi:hypothetical protein FB382_000426 [Nocardioides ginsengisegetis]|uniref:WD40-like Beta Propeller Repeat n=1 Tax=Nocardioides ginsengisegetis TaxID=661491 RepID=A0A7W3IWV3_9ACTN|nr:hypothetical protein [Nocardioides ginsengisegetis]MBA8802135.1 hypothetical protein [Nocardioides ginsengisegetis]